MSNRLTPSTRHVFFLCFLSRFNLCFARLKLPMSMNHWKKDWTRLKFGGLHRPFRGWDFYTNGDFKKPPKSLDCTVQFGKSQRNSRLIQSFSIFRCLMIQNCCRLVFALVFLATGKGNIHLTTTVFKDVKISVKGFRSDRPSAVLFCHWLTGMDSLLKDWQINFHKIGRVGSGSLQMYHLQGSRIKCDYMQLRNVLEHKNILWLYLVLCIMIISSALLLENLIRCSRYFLWGILRKSSPNFGHPHSLNMFKAFFLYRVHVCTHDGSEIDGDIVRLFLRCVSDLSHCHLPVGIS